MEKHIIAVKCNTVEQKQTVSNFGRDSIQKLRFFANHNWGDHVIINTEMAGCQTSSAVINKYKIISYEEFEKTYLKKPKLNSNTDFEFTPGEVYVGSWDVGSHTKSNAIFKPHTPYLTGRCQLIYGTHDGYEDKIDGCCTGNNITFRKANADEKIWLEACIKADKFIPLDQLKTNYMKFKVGDDIKFRNCITRIPNNFSTNIPSELVKHGDTAFKENKGRIISIHNEYYVVAYVDASGQTVQLGFKEEDLEPYIYAPAPNSKYNLDWCVVYSDGFTEDLYNQMIKWCKEAEPHFPKKKWYPYRKNQSYKDFKDNGYFWFRPLIDKEYLCGVDNNKQDVSLIGLCHLKEIIGYKETDMKEELKSGDWVVLTKCSHKSENYTEGKAYQLGGKYWEYNYMPGMDTSKKMFFTVKDDKGQPNGSDSHIYRKALPHEIPNEIPQSSEIKVGDWVKCIGESNKPRGKSTSSGWHKDLVFKVTDITGDILWGGLHNCGVYNVAGHVRKAYSDELPEKERGYVCKAYTFSDGTTIAVGQEYTYGNMKGYRNTIWVLDNITETRVIFKQKDQPNCKPEYDISSFPAIINKNQFQLVEDDNFDYFAAIVDWGSGMHSDDMGKTVKVLKRRPDGNIANDLSDYDTYFEGVEGATYETLKKHKYGRCAGKMLKRQGIEYAADYQMTDSDRSLVDKITVDEPNLNDLLEKAKKIYPIGTKFFCANGNVGDGYKGGGNENYIGNGIWEVTKYGICDPGQGHSTMGIHSGNGWLWYNGNWAMIVDMGQNSNPVPKIDDISLEWSGECSTIMPNDVVKLSDSSVQIKVPTSASVTLKNTENEVKIIVKQSQSIKIN